MHPLRSNLTNLYNLLCLYNHNICRCSHKRIEVICGAGINKISLLVCNCSANKGNIRLKRLFKQVGLAIYNHGLLTLCNHGTKTCCGKHTAKTCTGSANSLCHFALLTELYLQLTRV